MKVGGVEQKYSHLKKSASSAASKRAESICSSEGAPTGESAKAEQSVPMLRGNHGKNISIHIKELGLGTCVSEIFAAYSISNKKKSPSDLSCSAHKLSLTPPE